MAARHTDPARYVLRSPRMVLLAQAVSAGAGVAALLCFTMARRPKVRRLFKPEPEGQLWLAYHVDFRATARVRAVVDLLTTCLEQDAGLLAEETRSTSP